MDKEHIQKNRLLLYSAIVIAFIFVAFLLNAPDEDREDVLLDGIPHDKTIGTITLALIEHNKQILRQNLASSTILEETALWQEFKSEEAGFSIRYPSDLIQMRYDQWYRN